MYIKKILRALSVTIAIPIITYGLIAVPFTTLIEKFLLLITSIITITFIIRKSNLFQNNKTIKKIYYALLYFIGITWTLFFLLVYSFEQGYIFDRKIYDFGIYCATELHSWDNEVTVKLVRYDLSGSHQIETLDFYKKIPCDFKIVADNDSISLKGYDCDERYSDGNP